MKLANNVNISQLSMVGNGVGATTTATMCKKFAGVVGTIVAFLHNITRSTKKNKRQKRNNRYSAPHTHTLRHTILEKTVDEKLPQHHHCHWKLMPTLLQVLLDVASGAAAGDDGGGGELLVLATLARKHFNLIDIAT